MRILAMLFMVVAAAACTPEVKIQAPDKPIEINLNVKIEHKIKIEIEKDVKTAISKNPELF